MRPNLLIREAESAEDLHRICRFRYDVYVTEMQREQRYADHGEKTVLEPYDATARNYMALLGDELIGVMRCNEYRDGNLGDYPQHYSFDRFDRSLWDSFGITTKLIVAKEYRNGPLGVRLACRGYSDGLHTGIRYDFIDCNPHLEQFFARLGYRQYRPRLMHPEYGDVMPLYLHFTDLDHLTAVGSPFARILTEWQTEKAAATALDHQGEIICPQP